MFFYVDESGHTGKNLFDEDQPVLYYGVLSSKTNIDILSKEIIHRMREKVGASRLHANELGNGGIVKIMDDLLLLQKKHRITFDIYSITKKDHALISFFDQVFDPGVNSAAYWPAYWTPLRYIVLLKLASLFDNKTLKKAWGARIELNSQKAEKELSEVCDIIKTRVTELPDERSRVLIYDTLNWAGENPENIHYNAKNKKDILSITPNLIGFQLVMKGIGLRLEQANKTKSKIIVDHQSQFNDTQKMLADFFSSARDIPIKTGVFLPEISFSNMPEDPIIFKKGDESFGLELVDIYLWIFKRFIEKKRAKLKNTPSN